MIYPIDMPQGAGALYQFRDKIKLGRKLKMTDKKLEEKRLKVLKDLDVLLYVSKDVSTLSDHKKITVCLPKGFSEVRVEKFLGLPVENTDYKHKMICVGNLSDTEEDTFTLWKIEEITYLKVSSYRYITCSYIGGIVL